MAMASAAAASLVSMLRPPDARKTVAPPLPLLPQWLNLTSPALSFASRRGWEGPLLRSRWSGLMSPIAGGSPRSAVATVAAGNYNVQVVVGEDEPDEEVVRKFRGLVLRAGIIQECKRRRFFEDKQAERKRRTREAAKRNKRRRSWVKRAPPAAKKQDERKDDGEEEDNWELPAGGIP